MVRSRSRTAIAVRIARAGPSNTTRKPSLVVVTSRPRATATNWRTASSWAAWGPHQRRSETTGMLRRTDDVREEKRCQDALALGWQQPLQDARSLDRDCLLVADCPAIVTQRMS